MKARKIKTGVFHSYAGVLFNTITDNGEETTTEILGIPIYDDDEDDLDMALGEVLKIPCDCCRQPITIRFNADGDIVSIRCNHCQNAPPAT